MVAKYKKGDKVSIELGFSGAINSGTVNDVYFQMEKDASKTEMLVLINLKMHNGQHYKGQSYHVAAKYVGYKPEKEAKYSLWTWI